MSRKSRIKDWQEFACGAGAASSNLLFTYPAFKLMIRQQVDGVNIGIAFKRMKREGLWSLYRGMLPPLLLKTSSVSVMFGMYHKFERIVEKRRPSMNRHTTVCTAAFMAGSVEALLTPFERVQTLLSDHRHNAKIANTVHATLKIWKHYTLKEYYRGFTAILLRNGPSTALFFTLRQPVKDALPEFNSQFGNSIEDFISGAVLGATISTGMYPLNVVKANMQKRLGGPYFSLKQTFLYLYNQRDRKIRKLYLGVSVNFTRALLSWGIINATYEILKKLFINE